MGWLNKLLKNNDEDDWRNAIETAYLNYPIDIAVNYVREYINKEKNIYSPDARIPFVQKETDLDILARDVTSYFIISMACFSVSIKKNIDINIARTLSSDVLYVLSLIKKDEILKSSLFTYFTFFNQSLPDEYEFMRLTKNFKKGSHYIDKDKFYATLDFDIKVFEDAIKK